MLRDVSYNGTQLVVTITPTYSGCPAMDRFQSDIKDKLKQMMVDQFKIVMQYDPPWTTDWINEKTKTDKDDASAAANDYLKTLGFVSVAYAWIKVLDVSFKDYNENKNFYDDKINTAKFYFDKVLPRAEQHYKSAISGSSNIMNFKFN